MGLSVKSTLAPTQVRKYLKGAKRLVWDFDGS